MNYDLFEHRHRFSVWAAARAAQRAFASVEDLRDALESTCIKDFVHDPSSRNADAAQFEARHREWCRSIVGVLKEKGLANATFGRAAKLVAVYLKAMVVVGPDSESTLAAVVHPPVDRILLKNLAKSAEIDSPYRSRWRTTSWTTLDEDGYYELVAQLRSVLSDSEPWWMLERHWTVTNDSAL